MPGFSEEPLLWGMETLQRTLTEITFMNIFLWLDKPKKDDRERGEWSGERQAQLQLNLIKTKLFTD